MNAWTKILAAIAAFLALLGKTYSAGKDNAEARHEKARADANAEKIAALERMEQAGKKPVDTSGNLGTGAF